MGGSGSGPQEGWGSKSTTESMCKIDIRSLKKEGYLSAGCVGTLSWSRRGKEIASICFRAENDRLVLSYNARESYGKREDIEGNIFFDLTACNFGGHRHWFRCPSCHRRVAIIYGGKYFRCRHCHNLTYESQNENPVLRMIYKEHKIKERLGGRGGDIYPFPEKPKGMHWKTYRKLRRKADEASLRSFWIL